jgi:rhodanese-related sulfurtransferase
LRELLSAEDSPYVLVDVREDNEWAEGHIPGALRAPMSRFDEAVAGLPEDKQLVFYCQSGIRSSGALRRSRLVLGLSNTKGHLDGGILNWARCGGPVER